MKQPKRIFSTLITVLSLVLSLTQVHAKTYFVHNDQLGTPQVITDNQQQTVWQAHYTPFGTAETQTDAITHNIRFPGQYYDSETGLHYNYFRYYDPSTGRYITSDPIGLAGGPNTYGYVGGNPLNRVDPLGLDSDFVLMIDPSLYYETKALEYGYEYSTKEGVNATSSAVQQEALYELAGLGLGAGIGKVVGKICGIVKKGADDILVLGRQSGLDGLAKKEGGRLSTTTSTSAKSIYKQNSSDIRKADKIIFDQRNVPSSLGEALEIGGGQFSRAEKALIKSRSDLRKKTTFIN